MRVTDPIGGPPDFEQFFRDYEHFRGLMDYSFPLSHLIARYSRGDPVEELRREFPELARKIVLSDRSALARFPDGGHIFEHHGQVLENFRDALVTLSLGLCLRASKEDVADILSLCERGDSLLETIAGSALGLRMPIEGPAFYNTYDCLYDALDADGPGRERLIREYLDVWYRVKMDGLLMKDKHLVKGRPDYVGYWCFEAAGVVASLNIDDKTFADHPHYPRDLVAFYRASGG